MRRRRIGRVVRNAFASPGRRLFGLRFSRDYLRFAIACARRWGSVEPGTLKLLGSRIAFANRQNALFLLHELFVNAAYEFDTDTDAPRIIDCGANIGLSVLFFKRLYPRARVVAFEPHAPTFRRLRDNIAHAAGLDDVELRQAAVSDRDEDTVLYVDGGQEGSLVASLRADWNRGTPQSVHCVRLADVVTTTVDFLKLDVEGAEYAIIRDLVHTGAIRNVRALVLEYHDLPTEPAGAAELHRLLTHAGMECETCADATDGRTGIVRAKWPAWPLIAAPQARPRTPSVAIVHDLPEEQWPSMDLVGSMLFTHLREWHSRDVHAVELGPRMTRRFTRLPLVAHTWSACTADRLLGRHWDYPRLARRRAGMADIFHVVDHSYAHLVHSLPAERTVVTCHDIDAFRCLVEPDRERRGWAFRAMTRRTLEGLQKAAAVTCDTAAVRDELLAHGLVAPERLHVVHNGVHPAFSDAPDADVDAEAGRLLGPSDANVVEILHVGSTIPRKAIDVLLRIVAAVHAERTRLRLVRVGGSLTSEHQGLARQLGIDHAVISLPTLTTPMLAAVYRRASVVVLPSRAEGFGLPVIEALACGTQVIASDLPALREAGGRAATYCPVDDVPRWARAVADLLTELETRPEDALRRRRAAVAQASQFTWRAYAQRMSSIYAQLLPC